MSATELFEARRHNLNHVFDELINTAQFKTGKEICEYYGLEASYIAQLLNSKRQIGEKAARELEQQLQLAPYLLDQTDIEPRLRSLTRVDFQFYTIQTVQQQLFQLQPMQIDKINTQALSYWSNHHYAIQMQDQWYAPILKQKWWVICHKGQLVQADDWVCVHLNNGLNLFLQFMKQNETSVYLQSLDEQRQVTFQQQDVLKIDKIVALLHPSYFNQA